MPVIFAVILVIGSMNCGIVPVWFVMLVMLVMLVIVCDCCVLTCDACV